MLKTILKTAFKTRSGFINHKTLFISNRDTKLLDIIIVGCLQTPRLTTYK